MEESPRASPQTPPPVPPAFGSGEVPVRSNVRAVVIASVIFLSAMAAVMFVLYELRESSATQRSQSPNSRAMPNQRRRATKDVAGLVPVATPTRAMPNVSQTAAEPSRSVPAVTKTFNGDRFVTLISPVTVRTPLGKTITLQSGAHFALLAVVNDQAVIRYYDGRKYFIPLSSTDYR